MFKITLLYAHLKLMLNSHLLIIMFIQNKIIVSGKL